MSSEHEYVEDVSHLVGPLDACNRRIVDGMLERRWLCSCGASGHWVKIHPQRSRLVIDQRLRSGHYQHVRRVTG